jgi:uncharacterized protein (DUF488 family)
MAGTIWTIGHSTRSIEEFIALLHAYRMAQVVDIRLIPFSRRYPHFHTDALAEALRDAAITYHHLALLGGRRKALPHSVNTGWRNVGFRGYADYMQSAAFEAGLDQLTTLAAAAPAAIMCAEAVPWRCHRSLVSDALVTRNWIVRHILTTSRADRHSLTAFARIDGDRITYPATASASPPGLY